MKNKFNYSWFFGILLVFTLYIFLSEGGVDIYGFLIIYPFCILFAWALAFYVFKEEKDEK